LWLELSGERHTQDKQSEKRSILNERSFGDFLRQIKLLPGTDPNEINAKLQGGVLEVVITKPTSSKGAKMVNIPILEQKGE